MRGKKREAEKEMVGEKSEWKRVHGNVFGNYYHVLDVKYPHYYMIIVVKSTKVQKTDFEKVLFVNDFVIIGIILSNWQFLQIGIFSA